MEVRQVIAEIFQRRYCTGADLNLVKDEEACSGLDGFVPQNAKVFDNKGLFTIITPDSKQRAISRYGRRISIIFTPRQKEQYIQLSSIT